MPTTLTHESEDRTDLWGVGPALGPRRLSFHTILALWFPAQGSRRNEKDRRWASIGAPKACRVQSLPGKAVAALVQVTSCLGRQLWFQLPHAYQQLIDPFSIHAFVQSSFCLFIHSARFTAVHSVPSSVQDLGAAISGSGLSSASPQSRLEERRVLGEGLC